MNENFIKGFEKVARASFSKEAHRISSTIVGSYFPLAAGLWAKKDRGLKTSLGSTAGAIAGGTLGGITASIRNPSATGILALLGASLGGGLGAYLAHGEDD